MGNLLKDRHVHVGSYLEGCEDGEDVGNKEESLMEDNHTNYPCDAHHKQQGNAGLQPMSVDER